MAVTAQKSTQCTNIDAVPQVMNPVSEIQGRIRYAQFDFVQITAAGDATSTADLCDLPGNAKVIPQLSQFYTSAFGGSRTLDVGYAAFTLYGGTAVAASPKKFVDAADVSSAGYVLFGTGSTASKVPFTFLDLSGTDGKKSVARAIRLYATVAGGTIPLAATINGWVAYVID